MRTALIILISAKVFTVFGQAASNCSSPHQLIKTIQERHINPRPIDNTFHQDVLVELAEILDPSGLVLTQQDLQTIQKIPLKLEDPTGASACAFVESVTRLYQAKLLDADAIISRKTEKPFDYKAPDSMVLNVRQQISFPATKQELERNWDAHLKYMVLERLAQEQSTEVSVLMKGEPAARLKVREREQRKLKNILRGQLPLAQHVTNSLLKAIALCFDPHTNYFTQKELEEFEGELSAGQFSFGFEIEKNAIGHLAVGRIALGGPAWNSQRIKKGDIIISIKWANGETDQALDFEDDELRKKLNSPDHSSATFVFQKNDGNRVEVSLVKSKVESIENNVRSLLLKGRKNVGYVSLPSFYTDWGAVDDQSCANDVAKEIIKLKKENIEGLILDLRFNGGGSLQEAIALAGIFIDVGTLAMVQAKQSPPTLVKDMNRGVAFTGPLLILVNGFSASASEVVAAGLQDYNRAMIAGTNTFGKSSSQIIFPVIEKRDTLGFVKITTEKLYRISGKSHQKVGVKPDFYLPDFYSIFEVSESNYRHVLPSDSVQKKVYFTPFQKNWSSTETLSTQRIQSSAWFKKLEGLKAFFKEPISLEANSFFAHEKKKAQLLADLEVARKNEKALFQVVLNKFDDSLMAVDSDRKDVHQQFMEEIAQSAYIEEAFKIILDQHNSKK